MLDEVGNGWPKHNCFDHQFAQLSEKVLPILKAGANPSSATFKPFADLKDHFSDLAPLPEDAPNSVRDDKPSPEAPIPKDSHYIKRMEAFEGETMDIIGIVRDISKSTKKIAALFAALGDVGRQLFRLPPANRTASVTIVDNSGEPNESYTCIMDRRNLDRSIAPGAIVFASLEGHAHGEHRVWLVKHISAL